MIHKLDHLPENNMTFLRRFFMESVTAAWSLHDSRQGGVPANYSFELIDESLIAHLVRRLPLDHNDIVRTELMEMLKTGIVTTSVSGW